MTLRAYTSPILSGKYKINYYEADCRILHVEFQNNTIETFTILTLEGKGENFIITANEPLDYFVNLTLPYMGKTIDKEMQNKYREAYKNVEGIF